MCKTKQLLLICWISFHDYLNCLITQCISLINFTFGKCIGFRGYREEYLSPALEKMGWLILFNVHVKICYSYVDFTIASERFKKNQVIAMVFCLWQGVIFIVPLINKRASPFSHLVWLEWRQVEKRMSIFLT